MAKEKTQKKKGKRKTLFIVLGVVLAIGIFGSAGENEDEGQKNNPTENIGATNAPTKTPDNNDSTQDNTTPTPESKPDSNLTMGQKNALAKAKDYLDFSAFSYSGLVKQLEYEGFSNEDATFAVDNCGADWGEQAQLKAKDYLSFSAFSYSGLIKQLEYEGFSNEDATNAADNCGADWNEQAALKAQDYLDFSAFSRDGLIEQLEYEGFTKEQAEYGVKQVGY